MLRLVPDGKTFSRWIMLVLIKCWYQVGILISADVFRDHELGLTLPFDICESSRLITNSPASPSVLSAYSKKSVLFAR